MKKVALHTLGCKLNQFESQALAESLRQKGFGITDNPDLSDCVLVNTCSVTNRADVKSRHAMRHAKKNGKTVIATGCYATTDFDTLSGADYADIVVKNDSKFTIPDLLLKRLQLLESIPENSLSGEFPLVRQFERTRAFVKIQDGCDKFCSYCKIPHARGRSRSFDPETVCRFVESLAASGYKEIILTGVNISDYRYGEYRLSRLLKDILTLPGDFRVRLSSLQPDEFETEILDYLEHPRIANHLHLSLQSGSSSVLARMDRHYGAGFFLDLVRDIRRKSPDCGLTTDIIVGFPGETDAEFRETLDFVRQAEFTKVHIFPFSPRSHTKAAKLGDTAPDIKKKRVEELNQTAQESSLDFVRKNLLGREYRVLTEAPENGVMTGYTPNYIKAVVKDAAVNEWVQFRAEKAEWVHDGVVLY